MINYMFIIVLQKKRGKLTSTCQKFKGKIEEKAR